MPIEYQVSNDGSYVHVVASGTVTAKESIDCQKSIAENSIVKLGYRVLFDTSKIAKIEISKGDIIQIENSAFLNPKNTPDMKVAIVANTMIVFVISRFYDRMISITENIIVFNNISSAKIWLEVM